jgi:hypothetical protein
MTKTPQLSLVIIFIQYRRIMLILVFIRSVYNKARAKSSKKVSRGLDIHHSVRSGFLVGRADGFLLLYDLCIYCCHFFHVLLYCKAAFSVLCRDDATTLLHATTKIPIWSRSTFSGAIR